MGADSLNFRVRDGNGCDPVAITVGKKGFDRERKGRNAATCDGVSMDVESVLKTKPHGLISTGQLNVSLRLHLQPITS